VKPAIRIENLSKKYRLGSREFGGYRTLREALVEKVKGSWRRRRKLAEPHQGEDANLMWAIKDVSLEIQPGEVVGLIGRNGAGKSTLLKILSRITEPTEGRVELRGRVGSLLEVGTGFHPELTGRENIYLNGSILGMSRAEITRKFDAIVAFAEIDRFLDTPVKRYSSGMYVRLAFAVAAHLELEILLVDEVLAVGDLEFQKKCLQKMGTIAESGRTVLFVSHNLGMIHRLCSKAVLLHKGQVQAAGRASDIIETYLGEALEHRGLWERPDSCPPGAEVTLRRAQVLNKDNRQAGIVNCDDGFQVCVDYEVMQRMPSFVVGFQVRNAQGVMVFTTLDSDTARSPQPTRSPGLYRATCRVPSHMLAPGTYFVTIAAAIINQQTLDTHVDVLGFEVAESGCIRTRLNDRRVGVITPILDWQIERIN
jgi:lipopolysaccharide transport system ATP-binding protein